MGRRGPKPTPTPILKRRGSQLAGLREIAGEPVYETRIPDRPESLDHDGIEYWDRITAILCKSPGLLTEIDGEKLGMLCQALADRDRFRTKWVEEGAVYETVTQTGSAVKRVNPAYTNYNAECAKIIKLAALFGMSPSDRAGIQVPGIHEAPERRSELIRGAKASTEDNDGLGPTAEE